MGFETVGRSDSLIQDRLNHGKCKERVVFIKSNFFVNSALVSIILKKSQFYPYTAYVYAKITSNYVLQCPTYKVWLNKKDKLTKLVR